MGHTALGAVVVRPNAMEGVCEELQVRLRRAEVRNYRLVHLESDPKSSHRRKGIAFLRSGRPDPAGWSYRA